MKTAFALLVSLSLALSIAAEGEELRRDPAAVAKVEAAEKLVYLPRREGLTKLKAVAKLEKPGKHAILDKQLGEFEVWLEEPEFVRLDRHGTPPREAEEVLKKHDAKRCIRADVIDHAVWPFALYPDADRKHVEFAPKSRTRVRIMDRRGTGVEVVFDRNGLPAKHTHYERGKRGHTTRLTFAEYEGVWLPVRRSARAGKDETEWRWKKEQGLWMPESVERTLGKLTFLIEFEYPKIERRPAGTPPILPPRSDPAALELLERADRMIYRPVEEGLTSVRFAVTVASERWRESLVFGFRFTGPKELEITPTTVPEELGKSPEEVAKLAAIVRAAFADLTLFRPPLYEDLEDHLVTKKPGEKNVVVISDRKANTLEVTLDRNGAPSAHVKKLFGDTLTSQRFTHRLEEGKFLITEWSVPEKKRKIRWTWREGDGFWLPETVVVVTGRERISMTATGFAVTKDARGRR